MSWIICMHKHLNDALTLCSNIYILLNIRRKEGIML